MTERISVNPILRDYTHHFERSLYIETFAGRKTVEHEELAGGSRSCAAPLALLVLLAVAVAFTLNMGNDGGTCKVACITYALAQNSVGSIPDRRDLVRNKPKVRRAALLSKYHQSCLFLS